MPIQRAAIEPPECPYCKRPAFRKDHCLSVSGLPDNDLGPENARAAICMHCLKAFWFAPEIKPMTCAESSEFWTLVQRTLTPTSVQ